MGVGGQHHALATLCPRHPGKTQYPLYRRMGGAQGRSGWVQKISPPPGFDPWAIQSVVYTRQYVTDVFAYTLWYHTNSWASLYKEFRHIGLEKWGILPFVTLMTVSFSMIIWVCKLTVEWTSDYLLLADWWNRGTHCSLVRGEKRKGQGHTCVCVLACEHTNTHTHTHTGKLYIYVFPCISLLVLHCGSNWSSPDHSFCLQSLIPLILEPLQFCYLHTALPFVLLKVHFSEVATQSVCPISPEGIWVIKSRMWLLAIDNSQFLVLMPLSLLLGCSKFYSRLNNSYQDRSKKLLLWHKKHTLGPKNRSKNIYQTCKCIMQLLRKCVWIAINQFFFFIFTPGAGNQKCIYTCCLPQTLSFSCSSKNLKFKVTN
jgi:hypothetical protein